MAKLHGKCFMFDPLPRDRKPFFKILPDFRHRSQDQIYHIWKSSLGDPLIILQSISNWYVWKDIGFQYDLSKVQFDPCGVEMLTLDSSTYLIYRFTFFVSFFSFCVAIMLLTSKFVTRIQIVSKIRIRNLLTTKNMTDRFHAILLLWFSKLRVFFVCFGGVLVPSVRAENIKLTQCSVIPFKIMIPAPTPIQQFRWS